MGIRAWPPNEQPREKLIQQGVRSLSDAELIALVFGSGIAGIDAVALARGLLARTGSLRGLLAADRESCCRLRGVGLARWCRLQAALEVARRHYQEPLRSRPLLEAPQHTAAFLVAQLRGRPSEVFCCLHLDSRHRLIAFDELFRGTIDGASVHPREVVRQALAHNAAAVIFAHNHPSGIAEASQADELITRRLRDALALLDIRVLDHFIVGDGACLSFAERGLL